LTDAGMAEAEKMFPVSANLKTIKKLVETANAEMNNKMRGYNDSIDDARRTIDPKYLPKTEGGANPPPAGVTPAPPAALEALRNNPALLPKFIEKYGYSP